MKKVFPSFSNSNLALKNSNKSHYEMVLEHYNLIKDNTPSVVMGFIMVMVYAKIATILRIISKLDLIWFHH